MKKIVALVMAVICFFALAFELSGSDPDKGWNFRSYVEYVTENIEPFPCVELSLTFDDATNGVERIVEFFEWIFQLVAYPFAVIGVVIRNVFVILDGFFPVNWGNQSVPGQSGGGDDYGPFGGGGIGGGGGGAR